MKIVILTSKLHPAAEFALNKLFRSKGELDIAGLVISDISPLTKSFWKYVIYGVKRSGLFYGVLIALISYLHLIGLFFSGFLYWWRKRQWLTLDELAYRYDVKTIYTENLNEGKGLEALKALKPDLVVSLYFDQILKTEAIQVASIATINMHPGILPGYRGVWPGFWKLYKGEKQAGVSIHYINEEIDAGELLAETTYPINSEDTKLSLSLKSANHGINKLVEILKQFKQGIKPHPIKKEGKSRYRSLPKKKHMDKYHQRGKKLFSFFKDLLSIMRLSRNLDEIDQSSSKSNSSTSSSKVSGAESGSESS